MAKMRGKTYVVMVRTYLYDFPFFMTRDEDHAKRAALQCTDAELRAMAALFGVDYAGFCNISIVTFAGHTPAKVDIVRKELEAKGTE